MFNFLFTIAGWAGLIFALVIWLFFLVIPVKIKFNYSWFSWLGPILLAFGILIISFTLELTVGYAIAPCDKELASYISSAPFISYKTADIVIQLLVNGVLIPGLCALVSWIFGHMIKQSNFDYLRLYSTDVPKAILSVLTVIICIRLLGFRYSVESEDDYFVLARILMWTISVIGTWFGFGFGCESRVDRKRKKEKSSDISLKMKLLFWGPIIIDLLFCFAILWLSGVVDEGEKLLNNLMLFLYGFVLMSVIMFIIVRLFVVPPIGISNVIFDIVYKKYKKGKSIYGRYGRLKYKIEDRTLVISDAKCKYAGHENDLLFNDLIHEKPIPLYGNRRPTLDDPKGIKELLNSKNEKREKGLSDCFAECVNELKKSKEKSL